MKCKQLIPPDITLRCKVTLRHHLISFQDKTQPAEHQFSWLSPSLLLQVYFSETNMTWKQRPIAHIRTSQSQHWRSWFTAQVQAVWKCVEEVEWHACFVAIYALKRSAWLLFGWRLITYQTTQTRCWWNICWWSFSDRLIVRWQARSPSSTAAISTPIVYWQVWDFTLVSDGDDDSCALACQLVTAPSWCRRTWWWGSTSGTRWRRTASGVQGSDPSSPHILWSQPDRQRKIDILDIIIDYNETSSINFNIYF